MPTYIGYAIISLGFVVLMGADPGEGAAAIAQATTPRGGRRWRC